MSTLLSICIVFIFIYFITIFHELGHALLAVLFTKENVNLKIGGNVEKYKLKLGHMSISFNGLTPYYGVVYWNYEKLSKVKNLIIYAAGPLFSVLLLGLFNFVFKDILRSYLNLFYVQFIFYCLLFQTLSSAILMRYPKFIKGYSESTSDGLNILYCLKSNSK